MDHKDEEAAGTTDWQKMRKLLNKHLREAQVIVSLDEKLPSLQGSPDMDPAVWRNLSEELLQMVFACLPLRQTLRLQCLSKAWRWNVMAKESAFRRVCASAASPKMFALVGGVLDSSRLGVVSIKLFAGEAHGWHVFKMALQPPFSCEAMSASDGGLVCFVSRMVDKVANPLSIVVLNPLTKEYKVLPAPDSLKNVEPQMVRIMMDRGTHCYKVIVVGQENRGNRAVLAEVYSSSSGAWSNTDLMPDLVFGYQFSWTPDRDDELAANRGFPCAYACRESRLLNLGDDFNLSLVSAKGYTLLNDRLFVLWYEVRRIRSSEMYCRQISRFILSEYQGQKKSLHWVKVRDHDCTSDGSPFSGLNGLLRVSGGAVLHSYGNCLLITAENYAILYDLSTFEWRQIPAMPEDEEEQPCIHAAMCELHLDAVP